MTTLLHIAVINAVTVLPLAVLAYFVSRGARRPALTHTLWVLVLLKFVTPPLFNLPVTIELPVVAEASMGSGDVIPSARVAVPQGLEASSARNDSEPRAEALPADLAAGSPAFEAADSSGNGTSQRASSIVTTMWQTIIRCWVSRPEWGAMLLGGWIAGVVSWTILQLVRAVRFQRRVLRDAIAPIELQEQTQRLALRLGLRRAPQLLIVDATVSPMLWGCGSRAKLLFPADLADRLDENARATLLTHELAHYGRGDHWVRLLELIATGLFWWHPVLWWARRQIEEAEEECCDAWVMGEFPDTPRQYAEALLDTIDFLCESRQALPPIASGLGQAHFLRRRLIKIMRGTAPKALSHRWRCAIALVAALLLPLQPFVFGSSSITQLRRNARQLIAPEMELAARSPESDGTTSAGEPEIAPAAEQPAAAPVSSSARSKPRGEKVWSNATSPDGRFVVQKTTARRVLLTDRRENAETDLSEHQITAVAFAPDGKWFAAAGLDGRVTAWDSASGELLRTVLTHGDVLRSVAVSPQGDTIAAGGRDGAVLVADLVTGAPVGSFPRYSSEVNCIRFASDGRQLAVAVGDWMSNRQGQVALLDAATGREVVTLDCVTSPGALTYASNDELIVGLWDGRTQLWNLVNRQIVGSALAHKNVVAAAAFSPDNPVLREVTFVASDPFEEPERSPLSLLRGLFTLPANSVK